MTSECNPSDERRLIMALVDLVSDEDVVVVVVFEDCVSVLMRSDGNGGGVILFISHVW